MDLYILATFQYLKLEGEMHSEPWQGIKRSNQQLPKHLNPKHHKYDSTECPLYDLLAIYSINQRGLKSQHRHWVQHPFPPIQPPLQINQKDLRRKENERGMNEAGQNKKMSLQRGFSAEYQSWVKSSHLYLYSAFNNTNCNKALHNIKIGKLCQ